MSHFTWLMDSIISDNVIEPSTLHGFDPCSSPEEEVGFLFANCRNLRGTGNRCLDHRYLPQRRIVIGDNCENVSAEVSANKSAEQEDAPLQSDCGQLE